MGKQLALLKNSKIVITLFVTFFWQVGYAVLYSYIAPFLIGITQMSERKVSFALFAFGIATLIGSKFGGLMTERIGVHRSLLGSMPVNVIVLVLLSSIARSTFVTIPLLMLWSFSTWSAGPTLQYNMVLLAPEASGIMLDLYGSILQFSVTADAGIGCIVAGSSSMLAISWIGAASVAIAVFIEWGPFILIRHNKFRKNDELKKLSGHTPLL